MQYISKKQQGKVQRAPQNVAEGCLGGLRKTNVCRVPRSAILTEYRRQVQSCSNLAVKQVRSVHSDPV